MPANGRRDLIRRLKVNATRNLSLLTTVCGCTVWSMASQRLRWYCEDQHLIFCWEQILWKWIEKRFKFFSQSASVNWTSWISTQLIEYLWKSFDPIIWSSNLRTTTEASNTPNVYSSGAVIPQYTSKQSIHECLLSQDTSITACPSVWKPVFSHKCAFFMQSSCCSQCLLLAVIRAQIFSNMQNITVRQTIVHALTRA